MPVERICIEDLTLNEAIAENNNCTVWKAMYKGELVAVRKAKITSFDSLTRFEQSVTTLESVPDAPGLLPLIAVIDKPPNYIAVSPWCENKCGFDLLHETPNPCLSLNYILKTAILLAQAIQTMHNQNIVHRDIKPGNILFDKNWDCQLSDFETAVTLSYLEKMGAPAVSSRNPSHGRSHHMVGTIVYMSPECLRKKSASFESDVYSFGITINEFISGILPYSDCKHAVPQPYTVLDSRFNSAQLTTEIAANALRPTINKSTTSGETLPTELVGLIQTCWSHNPENRPSIDEVLITLQNLAKGNSLLLNATPSFKSEEIYQEDMDIDGQNDEQIRLQQTKEATKEKASLDFWEDKLDLSKTIPTPKYNIAGLGVPGRRGADRMEDRHFIIQSFLNNENVTLLGVMDGHGGFEAAQYFEENFPATFQSRLLANNYQISCSLIESFEIIDNEFCEKFAERSLSCGCTAVVGLLYNGIGYFANAGDCRVVVCHSPSEDHHKRLTDLTSTQYTADHNAKQNPAERERIVNIGGKIEVVNNVYRVQGKIQVTRAIGDRSVKPYVISRPELTKVNFKLEDKFMVIATDGLWDIFDNDKACLLVNNTVKVPEMIVKKLCIESIAQGSTDNVTSILVLLQEFSNYETS